MLAPQMIPLVTEPGKNEVALCGYLHEPVEVLERYPEQERLLSQPVECSARQTGKRAVGSRTAGWARSIDAIAIVLHSDRAIAISPRPLMMIGPTSPRLAPWGPGGTRSCSPPVFSIFPLEVD
jgi:hypothetical protein